MLPSLPDDFSETFRIAQGESLARNLEEQSARYRAYATLLREQRQALLKGDMTGLETANASIEEEVSRLLELEVERESLTQSLLEAAGVRRSPFREGWISRPQDPEPPVKCEPIAEHLPPASAGRLLQARDGLHGALEEIRSTVRVNSALAENGRRLIATTLASLTNLTGKGAERLSIYSPGGRTLPTDGRRQVRNLGNRSA